MKSKYFFYLRGCLIVSDLIVVNAAFLLGRVIIGASAAIYMPQLSLAVFSVLCSAWILSALFTSLYRKATIRRVDRTNRKTMLTALFYPFICISSFLLFNNPVSPKFFICSFLSLVTLLVLSRAIVSYLAKMVLKNGKYRKHIAIVGYDEIGLKLADYFNDQKSDYVFEGFFNDNKLLPQLNTEEGILTGIEECIEYANKNKIQEVYSTVFPNQRETFKRIAEVADKKCVKVKFVYRPYIALQKPDITYVKGYPIISMRKDPLDDVNARVIKRAFDIVVSCLAIVFVLSWLIPLVGLAIKLDSKGPVFFKQKRGGRSYRKFKIYKFRTMTVAEKDNEFKQATKDDARVTRVGKFLRRTSIDELPQFINVLRGNMSACGPRPHPLKLNETFMESIDSYMARHFIKPGVSGWAQVNGFRGETETPELMKKRIEHDIWYLENWSIMLDIKIVFKTIKNMIRGEKNAY